MDSSTNRKKNSEKLVLLLAQSCLITRFLRALFSQEHGFDDFLLIMFVLIIILIIIIIIIIIIKIIIIIIINKI